MPKTLIVSGEKTEIIWDLGYEYGFWAKVVNWHGSEKIVVLTLGGEWVFPLVSVEERSAIDGHSSA